MSEESWIVIHNWERFQYRTDRPMTWIQNHTALLHDDDYLSLTGHQRAVLHGLWLVYASSNAQLRVNTASLSRQLGLRVSSRQLERLNSLGFIEFSGAKPAPLARARKGKESKPPKPPAGRGANSSNSRKPKTTGWRLVRGSHGQTLIPDPNGTDKPPAEARP